MDEPTDSNASSPSMRRPPVPLPRKSVPKRGSKTHSQENGEIPKVQSEPKSKGPYAKIKSILGKNEPDKPKLPPRPTKRNSAKGSRSYGVIPRSGNQNIHERNASDSTESNGDRRERMPGPPMSAPRGRPPSPRQSPTGMMPRQSLKDARAAPALYGIEHEANYKRSHSRTEITSKNKLLLTAQKALEKSIRAELDVENSKHLEATKKYQECLDDIDLILETPLRKLKLSQRDKYEAENAVQEMKRLRKSVLQGFSDAQTAYCLPQSMVDTPAEAPPSYNDVLMEDLLDNNSETQGDAVILQPISLLESTTNKTEDPPILIGITPVDVPTASCEGNSKIYSEQRGAQTESVKPKVKAKHPYTVKPEFPADVLVPREQKMNFLADRASKSMSCDSIPDSDFVTAQSTPILSPFKQPRADNPLTTELILRDVQNQLNSQKFSIDPFQNENPFTAKFEPNLNHTHGDIFGEMTPNASIVKPPQVPSDFTDISFNTYAVYSPNNPFVTDLRRNESVKSDVKTPCTESSSLSTSDMFGDLAYEVRKQFDKVDPPDSSVSEHAANPFVTPQSVTRTVNKQQIIVQSPLGIKALNEIEGTDVKTSEDHFTKRKKQAQSVMNIPESVEKGEKESRLPNRHPLTRLKKMSRSNESLLQMFDPIKASHECSSLSEDTSNAVEARRNETQKEENVEDGDEAKKNSANVENDVIKPLVEVSDDAVEAESNFHSRISSEIETSSTNSKNSTLYPKLPGVEIHREEEASNDFSSSSSSSIAEECYDVSRMPKGEIRADDFDSGAAMAADVRPQKKFRPPKPVRKKVEPNGRQKQPDQKNGVTIGRSAFYAQEAAKEVGQVGRDWAPVFHVKDAVKLFFLINSQVTSPFNRQTIQLLKKSPPPPGSRSAESKVRLEIGGELFARDLEGKTTRVLMDEYGDYVIEGSEGVFICMVLTSKVDKTQILEMERMFEIYTNLAKEPRTFNLGNNNVDNAARNALKVVQKKMPGIVKTHSVRAMKKIRGAIGKEEVRQELGEEFTALKHASVQFREARLKKAVLFF